MKEEVWDLCIYAFYMVLDINLSFISLKIVKFLLRNLLITMMMMVEDASN